MKKLILVPVLIFSIIVSSQDNQLNGAWKAVKAFYGDGKKSFDTEKTKVIKIFKDGYWIGASFGGPGKPFDGASGGTYTTEGNKYIESVQFFSWDSSVAGRTASFDYKLKGKKFYQEGFINTADVKNYLIKEEYEKLSGDPPLQNASLEGVWQMESATWQFTNTEIMALKMYVWPRFSWVHYHPQTKRFIAAGGGTYRFDGKKLIETIEYFTYESNTAKPGVAYEIAVETIGDNSFIQTDPAGYKETWKRLK